MGKIEDELKDIIKDIEAIVDPDELKKIIEKLKGIIEDKDKDIAALKALAKDVDVALVTVYKGTEEINVNPAALQDHIKLGWKVKG